MSCPVYDSLSRSTLVNCSNTVEIEILGSSGFLLGFFF